MSHTSVVVGASRGLGRGVAHALASAGHSVVALGRNQAALQALARESAHITVEACDATERESAAAVLTKYQPDSVVLVAGATPKMVPLSEYDWESYAHPFMVDTQLTFHWLKWCLNHAEKRRHIVVFSSGAALHGSPLSGGYAPAKQAQRFLCQYARSEAEKRKLSLTIQCLLPQLNPNTELGAAGIAAYAKLAGETPEAFAAQRFNPPLSPAIAGAEVARLLQGELAGEREFLLTGKGLSSLPK